MTERFRDVSPSGDTEEIILDEEEFERLLNWEEIVYVDDPEEDGYTDDPEEAEYIDEPEEEYIDEPEEDLTVVYDRSTIDSALSEYEEPGISGETVDDIEIDTADAFDEDLKLEPYEDEDEDDDEDDDEDASVVSIFSAEFFNKLVYLLGGLIALFAIIVGVVFITAKTGKLASSSNMKDIGLELEDITVIGEEGINAVFGHEAERLSALYEAAESFEYSEVDEETGLVNVTLALTSIQKDLKIKFVNKNNKLVANVPFKAEVTDPKGNSTTYTDDDKDGIIYLSDIASGDYSVKMIPLNDFSSLYSFASGTESVKVKDHIEYAKVDVSNEIRKESDAGAKDGQKTAHDTEVEGELKDTVEFVMTQKVALTEGGGFSKIEKSTVVDPKKSFSSNKSPEPRFRKLAGDTSGGDPVEIEYTVLLKDGEIAGVSKADITGSVTCSDSSITVESVTWSSKSPDILSVSGNTVTGKLNASAVSANQDVVITAEVRFSDGTIKSDSCTYTVTPSAPEPPEDLASFDVKDIPAKLTVGQTAKARFVIVGKDGSSLSAGDCTISCKSSDEAKATMSSDGTITAVAPGSVTFTVTCKSDRLGKDFKAKFTIEIVADDYSISVEPKSCTLILGSKESVTLKAVIPDSVADKSVSWKSEDKEIVTVKDGVLTPVKAGKTTVTCTLKADKTKTATCSVEVIDLSSVKDKFLVTSDGKEVYVKNSEGKYVQASYADYYTAKEFYIASSVEYKYMGWWTFDGKTYYYDKNGNKVTGDQVILGTKYTFSSDGVLLTSNGTFGIDVSSFQGLIDWNSVAKSGVSFAIIRCGFRGSTVGGLFEDSKFYTNIKNAEGAGIKVGVYFFSQARNEVAAVEEATMVLQMVENDNISYPIFLDVENSYIYPN